MLSGPAVRLEFSRPAEAPQTWRESVVPQTTKEVGSPVILGLNMVDLVLIVALLALATVGWRRGFPWPGVANGQSGSCLSRLDLDVNSLVWCHGVVVLPHPREGQPRRWLNGEKRAR